MKRRILLPAAILLAATAFWALRPHRAPVPPRVEAYAGAYWGDTREAVEASAGVPLEETAHLSRFYTVMGEASRNRSYSRPIELFGRPAELVYVFYDGRLASYYLLLSGDDPVELDRQMSRYLEARYGPERRAPAEPGPLKLIWQKPDILVNYWLARDPIRLSIEEKYVAVVGVVLRSAAEGRS